MEVYLDNSATTRPYTEVVDEMASVLTDVYANPSSLHSLGKKAEDRINEARSYIAGTLSCTPGEIVFTGGGTESDNLAVIGIAETYKKNGNKIITQKTEHMAVLESMRYLESMGFEVYYADVDKNGIVDADDVVFITAGELGNGQPCGIFDHQVNIHGDLGDLLDGLYESVVELLFA